MKTKINDILITNEDGYKAIRMANLATIGAHHINGVASLHSDLIKRQLLPEFADLWPDKFTNITNGVTPRRWVSLANPDLSSLLEKKVGNAPSNNKNKKPQADPNAVYNIPVSNSVVLGNPNAKITITKWTDFQ